MKRNVTEKLKPICCGNLPLFTMEMVTFNKRTLILIAVFRLFFEQMYLTISRFISTNLKH